MVHFLTLQLNAINVLNKNLNFCFNCAKKPKKMLLKQNIYKYLVKYWQTSTMMFAWIKKQYQAIVSITRDMCFIFQPAFGCCALQMRVEICFFNVFCAKKQKKEEKQKNWGKIYQKILFLLNFAPIVFGFFDPLR